MNKHILCAALVVIAAGMLGCQNAVIPCYDNEDRTCGFNHEWEDSAAWWFDSMVCNEAITVLDQCNEFVDWLPPWFPLPNICDWVFGHFPGIAELGTCQPLGEPGDPCAEGPDCASGVCDEIEGLCG